MQRSLRNSESQIIMRSECPFCGFQSSVHVVQAHIDRDHTPPSSALQLASSRSPTTGRIFGGPGYRFPASDPYSTVRERQITTRRYPTDEPSWIKCGVLGCGMYVPEKKMNEHLDMHDLQAEDIQRARRLHEMSVRGGGAGFPSPSRGSHPSSRTLRRIEWGPMMGDHDYDDISVFSRGSGGSDRGSSFSEGAGGGAKSLRGKRDQHAGGGGGGGGGGNDGSGKDGKDSSRKDARRGWSRSSTSGKEKDGKASGSRKSVNSSSSSVVTTSSRARSERGGGGGEGGGGRGGSGKAGSGGGSGGGGGSGNDGSGGTGGGGGPSGENSGNVNASRRGSGEGGSGSGAGPGPAGSGGPDRGSPGGGNPGDPMFGPGSYPGPALASTLGGTGGPHGTDMGGLELQLAKLLLANRAGPDAGAAPSLAPGAGSSDPSGGANPPMTISPAATNEFMQALQRGMRPAGSDHKPPGLDQRIPTQAANLLAAIVASRAAGGGGY